METENKKETEKTQEINIREHGTIDMLKSHYPKFSITKSDVTDTLYFIEYEEDVIGYIEVDD